MTRHIFVTGGVVSSLGKGLTSAAIGLLLEGRGLKVALQKLDPYLNVDPGTMSPFQHGEVYVTADGAETDLDLGHYERFTNATITRDSNYTTGQIYSTVIARERRGDFLGGTVQVVPHVTDEIKGAIQRLVTPDVDVVITEIGGTVGDIESLPFLEAIRQFGQDVGRGNAAYVHLTLVPYLRASEEIKTKPTQHSVGRLREIGIMPDVLVCRTEMPLDRTTREKIALFCNVPAERVLEERDVETSIYEVPLLLAREGIDRVLVDLLGLPEGETDLSDWERMVEAVRNPEGEIEIAVVGKYIDHKDAYKSIDEALAHGGVANRGRVNVRRVEAEEVHRAGAGILDGVHGVLVPGGFGSRGTEGKIEAVEFARERGIPFLGICLGMQCAAVEFARNVLNLPKAHSREFDADTPDPVIDLMETQRAVREKGGTMRLGSYPCRLLAGSVAATAYGEAAEPAERHRHRYEFNNAYRERFEKSGMRFSGLSPDGNLVEMMELPSHPWFVAVQFHPEFQSKPTAAHPLFAAFVRAACAHAVGGTGPRSLVEAEG